MTTAEIGTINELSQKPISALGETGFAKIIITELEDEISSLETLIINKKTEAIALSKAIKTQKEAQDIIAEKRTLVDKQTKFLKQYDSLSVEAKRTFKLAPDDVMLIKKDFENNNKIIDELMSNIAEGAKDKNIIAELTVLHSEIASEEDNLKKLKSDLTSHKKYLKKLERMNGKTLALVGSISSLMVSAAALSSQLMDTTSLTSMAAITGIGAFVSGAYNSIKKGLNISPSSHANAVGVGAIFAGATAAALPELSEAVTSGYDMLVNFFNSLTPPTVETTILDQVMDINFVGSASEPSVTTEFSTLANAEAFLEDTTFTAPENIQSFTSVIAEKTLNHSIPDVAEVSFSPNPLPVMLTEVADLAAPALETTPYSINTEAEVINVQASTLMEAFDIAETFDIDTVPELAEILTYPEVDTTKTTGSFFKAVAPLPTEEPLKTIGTIAMNDPSTFPMNNPSTFPMDEPLKFISAPRLGFA